MAFHIIYIIFVAKGIKLSTLLLILSPLGFQPIVFSYSTEMVKNCLLHDIRLCHMLRRRTTRNPRLLLRLPGELLLRLATRQFFALLFQLPPRFTRLDPDELRSPLHFPPYRVFVFYISCYMHAEQKQTMAIYALDIVSHPMFLL